jgi:STAS domain
MVVVFGAALLLPFPRGRLAEDTAVTEAAGLPDDGMAGLWTARPRRRTLRALPPAKLLPDSQPAYVASWIYVFGVGALAALGVAIASGFALALGGPVIDLENLDFIDCHAAGALLGARETARQAGGDVLLAAPHGPVLRLLSLLSVPGVHAGVAAAADSAGRRDARRRAVSIVRSGSAALAGARYWMTAWRAAVSGARAGNRS